MSGQPKEFRYDVYSEDGTNRIGTILPVDIADPLIEYEISGQYTLSFSVPMTSGDALNLLLSRRHIHVTDIAEEAQGGYVPRKFRIQGLIKDQTDRGETTFLVTCEHISMDLLSEVIPVERTYANLYADEIMTIIMDSLAAESKFTASPPTAFLSNFIVDEFVVGGNRLNMLRELATKVSGDLVIGDNFTVSVLEKKDPETDTVDVYATPRYNLLAMQEESDSRRLVTKMYGFGSGEPRLTLSGTWHPVVNGSTESPNSVAIHKFAPIDGAFEPRDAGADGVVRYFLEFRISKGVYWPIKKFTATGDVSGADLIDVEIASLGEAVAWTVIHEQLKSGDFCRLWTDEQSIYVGDYARPARVFDPLNTFGPLYRIIPIGQQPFLDCVKMVLGRNAADNWCNALWRDDGVPSDDDPISGGSDPRWGMYLIADVANYFYWDNDHGREVNTEFSAERNEAPSNDRPGRAAYHPDYGVCVIGGHTSSGIRTRKLPKVDHYSVDAGSDETDEKTITDLASMPGGADNTYMFDIVRRGGEFVAAGSQDHVSQTAGAIRQAVMTDLSGSPTWSTAVHILNTPEATEFIKDSDASHPGGSGLGPKIQDYFLRCDHPDGGGLHHLVRFAYDDGGSDNSGHFYYQYADNVGEYLTDLDNFFASNDDIDFGYGILSVPKDNPAAATIAIWKHVKNATDDHDMLLQIYRRSGAAGTAGTWLFETVTSVLAMTDAEFANWSWTNAISNGKGNTGTDVNVDHCFDDRGNEHIVYSKDDKTGNKNVFYRFKDNSVELPLTPTWGTEIKLSAGSDWVEADFDCVSISIIKHNGYARADAGDMFFVYWTARDNPSVFDFYGFVAGFKWGDPITGDEETTSFDADMIVGDNQDLLDCSGAALPLSPVNFIEVRDRTNSPALWGYELHGWVDGMVEENSLEFTENLFDDGFLSRLSAFPGGLHEKLTDIGNGSPVFTKNTDRGHIVHGDSSQKVVTANANEGVMIDFDFGLASNCSNYFSVRLKIKLTAGEIRFDITEGDRDTWANRGTQTIFPPLDATENSIILTGTGKFFDISFGAIQRGGGDDGRIWIYQNGASPATFYIDAIIIEPLQGWTNEWFETSTKRLLWSRVYDDLSLVHGVRKLYTVGMRDLFMEGKNPYTEFNPRDVLQLENEEINLSSVKLLVLKKSETLSDPGGVTVEVASRMETNEDLTASAFARLNRQQDAVARSIRKQVEYRLRLGPPKIGLIEDPDDKTLIEVRSTTLKGEKTPY